MIFERIDKTYSEFLENAGSQVTIFCPYIQVASLKKILQKQPAKLSIVTSWKTIDLLSGVSQLELYPFCRSIGAYLYINQRVHLKVITDFADAVIGSANITDKGMGLSDKPNYECVSVYQGLDRHHQVYLRSILQESILMNDEEFEKTKRTIDAYVLKFVPQNQFDDIDFTRSVNKEFLTSSLPMSINIDTFFDYYSEKLVSDGYNDVDYNCATHDLALYKIPPGLDRPAFDKALKKAFFSQPFIQELKKFLSEGRFFGQIKEWVQKNCVDVPVPSRRDLTENIQVLYEWFKQLGRDEYIVDQPNHSERIRPKKGAKV